MFGKVKANIFLLNSCLTIEDQVLKISIEFPFLIHSKAKQKSQKKIDK